MILMLVVSFRCTAELHARTPFGYIMIFIVSVLAFVNIAIIIKVTFIRAKRIIIKYKYKQR